MEPRDHSRAVDHPVCGRGWGCPARVEWGAGQAGIAHGGPQHLGMELTHLGMWVRGSTLGCSLQMDVGSEPRSGHAEAGCSVGYFHGGSCKETAVPEVTL